MTRSAEKGFKEIKEALKNSLFVILSEAKNLKNGLITKILQSLRSLKNDMMAY